MNGPLVSISKKREADFFQTYCQLKIHQLEILWTQINKFVIIFKELNIPLRAAFGGILGVWVVLSKHLKARLGPLEPSTLDLEIKESMNNHKNRL